MNAKQKRFTEEYIIDLNATQAAIRCGYSEKTAYSQGQRLLKNVEVQRYIQSLRAKAAERNNVTIDNLINELKTMAFANSSELFDKDWNILSKEELSGDLQKTVSGVKRSITTFDGGTKEVVEVRTYNKLDAIEKLAKHLGFYEIDNKQKSTITPPTIVIKGNE